MSWLDLSDKVNDFIATCIVYGFFILFFGGLFIAIPVLLVAKFVYGV